MCVIVNCHGDAAQLGVSDSVAVININTLQ